MENFPEPFHNDEWEPSIGSFQYDDPIPTIEEPSVFENQKRLFYLAIVDNNLDLIKSLLDCGYDINTRNDTGDTALLTALKSMNFQVAKYLLDANADVCVMCLRLLVINPGGSQVIQYIIPSLIDNLRRKNVDDDTLFESLVAAGWTFEIILLLRNAWLTHKFLQRNRRYDYRFEMNRAMERGDIDSVELLMRYGNESSRWAFYQKINSYVLNKQIQLFQIFIERLSHWNVVCDEAIQPLLYLFGIANENYLRILLNYKIDAQVRKKFGIDLRTAMFANLNVDAIELLKNRNFDVNARGYEEKTALYYAIKRDSLKNVKFLLDSGANVNIKNDQGRTLLFESVNSHLYDIVRLLVEYGADVQVIDNTGANVFQLASDPSKKRIINSGGKLLFLPSTDTTLLKYLIAQLAINKAQGVTINQKIQKQIDSKREYKKIYKTCCEQLEQLKKCQIEGCITLFDVLTNDIERLSRSLRNQEYISLLDHYYSLYKLDAFYDSLLRKKFMNVLNLYRVKCDIADIISERTGKFIDFDHLVMEEISKYLNPYDINEFMKYSMWKRCNS